MPAVRIDTHAHAFTTACALTAIRRYTPEREAPLADYLAELDEAGITHGVLVQPSFLGTDNSYLMECLGSAPDRLRGVAVIDPSFDERGCDRLADAGIVGIRLNLYGLDPSFLGEPGWQDLFRRAAARQWHIEIHIDGPELVFVMDRLWPSGAALVIDHFGRPDPRAGLGDAGFRRLLAAGDSGRIWVKLSGPYRCGGDTNAYAAALLASLGPEHLLWGSDWPWTQHSEGMRYARALGWLSEWVPDPHQRATILDEAPRALFRFAAARVTTR